jgi:hypothetical protein
MLAILMHELIQQAIEAAEHGDKPRAITLLKQHLTCS